MKKLTLLVALTFSLTTVFAQTKTTKTDKAAPATQKPAATTNAKAAPAKANPSSKVETKTANAGKVFCCDSKTATVYHNSQTCTGAKKCTGAMKEMTKADAEKAGKKPCKLCEKVAAN